MSGVSAVGEATSSACKDAVKLVMNESLDRETHVVLPDENIDVLAEKYGVNKRDLIRVNSLCRRSLRAGQELVIPSGDSVDVVHPNEILILKATNEHDQEGKINLTLDKVSSE